MGVEDPSSGMSKRAGGGGNATAAMPRLLGVYAPALSVKKKSQL